MIHVRKTGALILAALRIGAQVAKATSADLARLSRYGEYLGLAFQIADDRLDSHGGECWHGSRVEPQGAEEVDLSSGCRNRRSSGAAQEVFKFIVG